MTSVVTINPPDVVALIKTLLRLYMHNNFSKLKTQRVR
jgi:hypothetical protein